ncbi:MAG: YkgJ family cysteine cluster protein [Myxococcales bacterium]|nr:YkgJ family cysteine cluster protein [Myxococcales bacterium]
MTRRLPLVGPLGPDAIAAAFHHGAAEMAREGERPGAMAAQALAWLDGVVAEAKRQFPPAAPIGCAEGCAYCCHLKVIATPAEIIGLYEHLTASLSEAELGALRSRVEQADARTRGLTADARAMLKLPCPLLVEARCIAYEHRPLHCAGANAADPAACREAFESPERDVPVLHYPAQRIGADAATAGLSRALFESGKDGRMVELIAALAMLFADPSVVDRWRDGQQAFGPAVDRELEMMLQRAQGGE